MKKNKQIIVIFSIILLAAFFRFAGLGSTALSEEESILALQANDLATGNSGYVIAEPLYVFITAFLVKLFGAGNFVMRLFPAVMGLLLVMVPLLFGPLLSDKKKMLLMFFLALDPALIAWSRQADSLMPLICLCFCAAGFLFLGRKRGVISLIVLAILGGERFFPVLISGFLASLIVSILDTLFIHSDIQIAYTLKKQVTRTELKVFFGLLLLFGTAFLSYPIGINAIGNGLVQAFTVDPVHDFRNVGSTPLWIALFFYEGFAVVLFLIALWRSFQQKTAVRSVLMMCVLLGSIFQIVFNQGILYLPWMSVPLWYFGVDVLLAIKPIHKKECDFFMLVSLTIPLLLAGFLVLRASEMLKMGDLSLPLTIFWNNSQYSTPFSRLQAYILIILICVVIFTILIPLLLDYFSPGKARRGLLLGTLFVLTVGMIGNSWAAAGFTNSHDKPLKSGNTTRHELILGSQINQVENEILPIIHETGWKKTGFFDQVNGVITVTDDPLLRWAALEQKQTVFSEVLNLRANQPSYVITAGSEPELINNGYLGIVSDWKTVDNWESYLASDWFRWFLYRDPVLQKQSLMVWQNSQIITGSKSE